MSATVIRNTSYKLKLYVASISLAGGSVIAYMTCRAAEGLLLTANPQFVVIALLVAAGAWAETTLYDTTRINTAYPLVVAVLLVWGIVPAMWIVWPAMILLLCCGRAGPSRTMFNIAQLGLSAWAGGVAFCAAGGSIGAFSLSSDLFPLVVATVVYDAVNVFMVAIGIALRDDVGPMDALLDVYWTQRKAALPFQHALALVGAIMLIDQGLVGLLLLAVVLGALRYVLKLVQQPDTTESARREDPVTGLPNYRFLTQWLMGEGQRMVEEGTPFSILLLDVNGLKAVNDRYGHPAGDEVLRTIARSAAEIGRHDDQAVRYGGDEFVLLLTHTRPRDAVGVARRLVDKIRLDASRPIFHVSIGIAGFPDTADSPLAVLSRADQASCEGKRARQHTISVAVRRPEPSSAQVGAAAQSVCYAGE